MSGEAVVLSGVSAGLAGVAVAAGAAYVVAGLVADWIEKQRAIAQREARRQQAQIDAWRQFQRTEQRRIEQSAQQREAVRRSLESVRLTVPAASVAATDRGEARGFVREAGNGMGDLLHSVLAALPPDVDPAAFDPLRRLERQARELDRQPAPAEAALHSFRTTVQGTLERILDEMARESAARVRRLERIEGLLGETLLQLGQAREPETAAGLAELREHLVRLLTSGAVDAAGVELLEGELERLKARVEAELEQAAIAAALHQRTCHHLETLGYRLLGDGPPEVWEIPGGERVRVALQPGNRLAFQLVHERTTASDRPLDAAELAFLRAQEQRWCGDLHGLIRGLQADGFELQVQLERETPEASIPLVVVEDVDEWETQEATRGAPQRRRLT